MTNTEPAITTTRRLSAIWILPLAALVIGIWMVVQAYLSAGPTIVVEFAHAEGLEQGKTKVKMLNVEVGLVETVALKKDASGVRAHISLQPSVAPLLRQDTRFWVVRARVGTAGITGIGTLLSGGYIELAPGSGKPGQRHFIGLETPPLTPLGAPGKRLKLVSKRAAISVGDPILYKGFRVGRVEAMAFNTVNKEASYDLFVDAPYDELITSTTRFWDVSGISINASAGGIQLNVGTVETLLLGGVSFATPSNLPSGAPVEDGAEFDLYDSYADILTNPYRFGTHFVVEFGQAIGGLVPGAPVTFRGIQIGSVERILLREFSADGIYSSSAPIPVLIYVEPGRLEAPDTRESVEELRAALQESIANGLRATLQVGNLLTGRQQINFDYFDNVPDAELKQFDQYVVIPSVETGVGRLEHQVGTLLTKLNSLELEDTVVGANRVLAETRNLVVKLNNSAAALNTLLETEGTRRLPGELAAALTKLNTTLDGYSQDGALYQNLRASAASLEATLSNLDELSRQLADKPNSLLFAPAKLEDPIPEAKR